MIHTKLHKLLSVIPKAAGVFSGKNHYVITPEVLQLLDRIDVQEAIGAMIEAKIARLPFPEIVLEFEGEEVRRFVYLTDCQDKFSSRGEAQLGSYIGLLHPDEKSAHLTEPVVFGFEKIDGRLNLNCWTNGSPYWENQVKVKILTGIGLNSVLVAFLLLNTRGIAKDVIETTRLNKARAAKGKRPIPTHSVLRIATVYDRNGNAVNGHSGARGSPVVHLRAGHVRKQRIGPGRTETKTVYIEPVLVNYRPGGPEPAPRTRIVIK